MNSDLLKRVDQAMEAMTRGKPVQFSPQYCDEAKETKCTEWDTSHDLSIIREDGSRYRIGTFRHADDALFDQLARELLPEMDARIRELEAQVAEGVKVRPLQWVERRNDTWEADGYQVIHTYSVFWRVRRHGKILCRNIKGRDRAMDWANRHNERRIRSALEQPATPHGT